MRKIGIVTPVLCNFKGYCNFIRSLAYTKEPFNLCVMDNWDMPDRSVAQSWNHGIMHLIEQGCTHILVTNDDIILSPDLPSKLADYLDDEENKANGVMMATACNRRDEKDWNGHPTDLTKYETRDIGECPDFSCFMITPETFEKVGMFDENFKPAYFEDNDYHRRINLLGYHAINVGWAPMHHIGSVTQNSVRGGRVRADKFNKNRLYFIKKWGGPPDKATFTHPYNDDSLQPNEWRR